MKQPRGFQRRTWGWRCALALVGVIVSLSVDVAIGLCGQVADGDAGQVDMPKDSSGVETEPGYRELAQLARRFEKLQAKYNQLLRDDTEQTKSQIDKLVNEHAPMNVLASEFIQLEKRYRGTQVGISALSQLLRKGDDRRADSKRHAAFLEGLEVASQHYLQHPSLDGCMYHIGRQSQEAGVEKFLKLAAKQSPHRHVQAEALLNLADSIKWRAMLSGTLKFQLAKLTEEGAEQEKLKETLAHLERVRPIDPERAKAQVLALVARIEKEYADVRAPAIYVKGPGQIYFYRDTKEFQRQSPYERARALRFEMTKLEAGQMAPDIRGVGVDGNSLCLSDHRGKTVLLMFSANWCGPCKAMYPTLRGLAQRYRNDSFVILGVMGDEDASTVRAATDEGEITWRTWWDGSNGPIAARWNVDLRPTFYLIDRDGRIRYRVPGPVDLDDAVAELVGNRNAEPSASSMKPMHASSPELPTPSPEHEELRESQDARSATRTGEFKANMRVNDFVFDANGKFLIAGGNDEKYAADDFEAWERGTIPGIIRVWHASSGKPLYDFSGEFGRVGRVAISPGGKTLATSGSWGYKKQLELILWDVGTGTRNMLLNGHANPIRCLAFSGDGTLLASGGRVAVKIWDVASGRELATFKPFETLVAGFHFNAVNNRLLLVSRRGDVEIREVGTWKKLRSHQLADHGAEHFALATAISANGELLAVAGLQGRQGDSPGWLILWNIRTDKVIELDTGKYPTNAVSFSPDGSYLAAGGFNKPILFWKLADASVNGVAGNEDESVKRIVDDGVLKKFWQISPERVLFVPKTNAVAFDNSYRDNTIEFWNLDVGGEPRSDQNPPQ